MTRRGIESIVGHRIETVERTDDLVVAPGVDDVAPGARVEAIGRRGKQLVLHTDHADIGVHLGMTGRLLVDDDDPVGRLAYGGREDRPAWDRWVVRLDDQRRLRLQDPRRLGRVVLDPDLEVLGPDVMTLTTRELRGALTGRSAPLKAVLLDQHRVAGLGNLLVDEVLWRAGLDPRRPAGSLSDAELARLHRTVRRRLSVMLARGGSHTGTISPARRAVGGGCSRCGAELQRATVAGRTTWWCPVHQV